YRLIMQTGFGLRSHGKDHTRDRARRGSSGARQVSGPAGRAGGAWATVTRPRTPFGGASASQVTMQGRAAHGMMRDAERSPPMPRRRSRPAAAPVLAVLALGALVGCGAVTG